MDIECVGRPFPFRVTILITPDIASEPQRVDCDPRNTSILSILSVVKCPKLNWPVEGRLTRTPSIVARTPFDSPARMNTLVVDPIPPFWTTSIPKTPFNASATVRACFCSISFLVIIVTEEGILFSGVGVLIAFTSSGSSTTLSFCALAEKVFIRTTAIIKTDNNFLNFIQKIPFQKKIKNKK